MHGLFRQIGHADRTADEIRHHAELGHEPQFKNALDERAAAVMLREMMQCKQKQPQQIRLRLIGRRPADQLGEIRGKGQCAEIAAQSVKCIQRDGTVQIAAFPAEPQTEFAV